MKTKTERAQGDVYLTLVQQHPLRPIRTAAEHAAAVAVAKRLMLRPPGRGGKAARPDGERDYLDVLTTLINAYERKAYPIERGEPVERLKFLLDESQTSQGQLAALLGVSQPAASLIMNGRRSLTVDAIKRLAGHFKLAPGYFI